MTVRRFVAHHWLPLPPGEGWGGLMKTNQNCGPAGKLMRRLSVARYWLPLPSGESWGEGRRGGRAGLLFAGLFHDQVGAATTSNWGNANPHPSPLPRGEGASFSRCRRLVVDIWRPTTVQQISREEASASLIIPALCCAANGAIRSARFPGRRTRPRSARPRDLGVRRSGRHT